MQNNIVLNIFSICILIIIGYHSLKNDVIKTYRHKRYK